MTGDIMAAKYALIAEARLNWTRDQQIKASITGEQAQPAPSDSMLISVSPPLAQKINALQAQEEAASPGTTQTALSPVATTKGESTPSDAQKVENPTNLLA